MGQRECNGIVGKDREESHCGLSVCPDSGLVRDRTDVIVAIFGQKCYSFTLQRLLASTLPQFILRRSDVVNEAPIGKRPSRLTMHNGKVLGIVPGESPENGRVG